MKKENIATTNPELIKYFVNIDDCYNYSSGSGKYVQCICPYCKQIKRMTINNLKNKGFYCNSCNDGKSFSEKFMTSLLNQINVEYISQLTRKDFSWCKSYRYDFYIKNNFIIETHGRQHYEENGFSSMTNGKTLEEEKFRDKTKKELALSSGIEHYIVLDCRKSELEWIKKSVMESELPTLFNFKEDDIDWLKCNDFAISNLFKDICDYFKNNYNENILSNICNKFSLKEPTVKQYLVKGIKLNLIDSLYKIPNTGNKSKGKNKNGKKVEIFKEGKSLGIFQSNSELERKSLLLFGTKLSNDNVSRVCNGVKNSYKGYTFSYI
jgi:hypothetical protein